MTVTSTTITRSENHPGYFTLSTPRKKHVEVSVSGTYVAIFIRRNGMGKGEPIRANECMGRYFHSDCSQNALLKAIEAYKSADIKAALRALLSSLL